MVSASPYAALTLWATALTLPLIDISVIYGTPLPWPSSNCGWACDLSLSDAAGCLLPEEASTKQASSEGPVFEWEYFLCCEPLQLVFILMRSNCHYLLTSLFLPEPWKQQCIWTSRGNQWIRDDSASMIQQFQASPGTLVIWLGSDIHVFQSDRRIQL